MSDLLAVKGVQGSAVASGIKKHKQLDLALIVLAKGSQTALVLTQNAFVAAPIIVAKKYSDYDTRALLINSGCANAGTGDVGINRAEQSCQLLAKELAIQPEQVLPFSTGVIGAHLPIDLIKKAIKPLANNINNQGLAQVSQAILTTDLCVKTATETIDFNGKTVTVTGIAKGSGMICPNMATMLAFIVSDVVADKKDLSQMLNEAVEQSFNRISIDGDTSTNDACLLSATGQSQVLLSDISPDFQAALGRICKTLALKIVDDGEGANKRIAIKVKGGVSKKDCLKVAYTVAHSPLVKTAFFASDANWGRILAAVGRSGVDLSIDEVALYLDDVCVLKNGQPDSNYSEKKGAAVMAKTCIDVTIIIGNSGHQETVWSSDLSLDYVRINAEYRS